MLVLGEQPDIGPVLALRRKLQKSFQSRRVVTKPVAGIGRKLRLHPKLQPIIEPVLQLVDGGFASHVLVPHPRYLLDYGSLPPALAGAAMCSGLTAYAALDRLRERAARGPALLVGMGGVGMMGLALARALFPHPPIVADTDGRKRDAALAAGAAAAVDPADADARKAILAATGGIYAACDFVGADRSLQFAVGTLARGGKVVVTGLFGGAFNLPVAMLALKAITIEGIQTGTLAQAREVLELLRAGKVPPVAIAERPLADAQVTLDDLRAGRIVGRVSLTP